MFLTYRALAGDRRARRGGHRAATPLYDFTARRRRAAHDLAARAATRPRSWSTRSRGSRRCTSPTAITAPRAPRAPAPSCGSAGDGAAEADTFIAVAFPDNQVQILPYNRMVKDLAGRTPRQFLAALRERFTVTDGGPRSRARKGEVVDVPRRAAGIARPSAAAPEDDSRASTPRRRAPPAHVLEPLLTIGDVRTDKRIDFVGGARGTERARERPSTPGRRPSRSRCIPVTVDDLMAISDAGGIMPPKSTWFEPKLRDGLLDPHDLTIMKVLVADKFEQSGIDGLKAAGCEVVYEPDLKDEALTRGDRDDGGRGAGRARHEGDRRRCSTPAGWRSSCAPAPATTRSTWPAASPRGIYVSNCPGKNAIAVAELAFALILALDRRVPDNVAELRAGQVEQEGVLEGAGAVRPDARAARRRQHRPGDDPARRRVRHERRAVEPAVRRASDRPMTEQEARELGIEAALRHGRHRARADAGRRRGARRHPQRPSRAWPRDAGLVNAAVAGAAEAGRDLHQHRARRGRRSRRARRRGARARACASASTCSPTSRRRDRRLRRPLVALPGVYGTHHIGASTDQAQEAIAAETVRIVRSYKETGRVPNVVNLAKRTPATHMLVVRHRDRPGVLAHVFDHLRQANLNVQETENIVFEGAEAAVARINLDGAPVDRRCATGSRPETRTCSICRW